MWTQCSHIFINIYYLWRCEWVEADTYWQSISNAWSRLPITEINWSIMPQGMPANSCSALWHTSAFSLSLQWRQWHRVTTASSNGDGVRQMREEEPKLNINILQVQTFEMYSIRIFGERKWEMERHGGDEKRLSASGMDAWWVNDSLYPSHVFCFVGSTNASINVNVATSRAALLERPPPIGTFVTMTASNAGTGSP